MHRTWTVDEDRQTEKATRPVPPACQDARYPTPGRTSTTTTAATSLVYAASPSSLWSPDPATTGTANTPITATTTAFRPPEFVMDPNHPGRDQPSGTSGSPSSIVSDNPSTSAKGAGPTSATSPVTRKKPGRGPGKKDAKEKATVSVRWDDGDLTERLISAIESKERWIGVFASGAPSPGDSAASRVQPPPVAKRDLQREIARHLFGSDPRFDLKDKKVLESLAVSVKNKLFKLTTLFNECKQELGHVSDYKSERDIPQSSEHAVTWARVRVKFPQFYRIRDMINMAHVPGTPRSDHPISPVEPQPLGRNRTDTTSSVSTVHAGQPGSSTISTHIGLRTTADPAKDLHPVRYVDQSPSLSSSTYMPATSGSITTSPYASHSPALGITGASTSSSTGYPYLPPPNAPRRRSAVNIQPLHHPYSPTAPSLPSTGGNNGGAGNLYHSQPGYGHMHHPQPRHHHGATQTGAGGPTGGVGGGESVAASSTSPRRRAHPYARPALPVPSSFSSLPIELGPRAMSVSMSAASPAPVLSAREQHTPSPPLSQTIQAIVSSLTEKKDKDRAREHELEVLRLQREEAERIRWHQREMLRLRIQLIRAQRTTSVRGEGTGGSGVTVVPGAGGHDEEILLGDEFDGGGEGDDEDVEEADDGEGEPEEMPVEPPSSAHGRYRHSDHRTAPSSAQGRHYDSGSGSGAA